MWRHCPPSSWVCQVYNRQKIIAAFKSGTTLEEIGANLGITRERVRQILKKEGLVGRDGGMASRSAVRTAEKAELLLFNLNARAEEVFGCSAEELVLLNGGEAQHSPGCLAMAYRSQKRNAERRGIEWEFTFPEWVRAWRESGHMHERGRGKLKYCMASPSDSGPYSPENVIFTTNQNNGREAKEGVQQYYSDNFRQSTRDDLGFTKREREAYELYVSGSRSPRALAEAMGIKYGPACSYFKKAERKFAEVSA